MFVALLLSLMLTADQTPASTATTEAAPASAPAATAKSDKADSDRLICKRESKPNSRFTTKVCKTGQEWEDRAEEARKAFGETQQRPMVSTDRGN